VVGACSSNQIATPTATDFGTRTAGDGATTVANDPSTRLAALLASGYDANASAHFAHLRTEIADYRISYQPAGPARDAEYLWTAQHYDRIVLDWGDIGSVPVYRRLNPTAQIFRYAIDWTVMQPTSTSAPNIAAPYYADMTAWFAVHPAYSLEGAFLHRANCGATLACRVAFKIWTDDRWAINPGDAGLRAYQRDRLTRLATDADGLFLDEQGSGDFDPLTKLAVAEYPDFAAYQRDLVGLIADERAALAGKQLVINNSTYISAWDADMVRAAGGSHGEYFNNPTFAEMEARWTFADNALAAKATLSMGPSGALPASYSAGGYGSVLERAHLWNLASYYLVAPATPGLLYLNVNGSTWNQPYASTWFSAIEANIGVPSAARRVASQGTDPSGRAYRVWARDYTNALVLVRPIISWSPQSYGDETAVNVALPADYDYRLLHDDGTLGPVITAIALRASESAILVKQPHVVMEATPSEPSAPAPSSARNPVLLVIDKDAVSVGGAPNAFAQTDLNADIAKIGQRQELRFFAAHPGKSLTLYSGRMNGYEGIYAPRVVPASWVAAGPTADGLMNYFRAGPGLGSPDARGARETLLTSVAGAVPLRATGLELLVGRTVCAVFMRNNTWVTSFAPIGVSFQGPNLGVAAFRVDAVPSYSASTTGPELPKLSITVLSAATSCSGALDALSNAPVPTNPQMPWDVR
jgi:hypothetical protein